MPDGPRLPGSAPDVLKRFVKCEVDRMQLDLGDMGWIPKPDQVPDVLTPSARVLDGATSTSATIRVGYGDFISIDLPASIVDGQLQVETTNLSFGIGPEVQKWVDAFNRQLRENGKQLESFETSGSTVTMTKQAVPAATDTGGAVAPVTTAVPGGTPPGAEPEPEPAGKQKGCFAWLAGALAAIAAAVGLTLAFTGDEAGDDAITSGTGEAATTSTTTEPPAPTTTVQVGQVPPPTDAALPDTRVCGAAPDTGGPWKSDPDAIARWEQATSWPCAPPPGGFGPCDPAILPCSTADFVAMTVLGTEGVDHTKSVTDPMTGESGASTVEHALAMYAQTGDVRYLVKITSDCGGNMLSGQAPLVVNGATIVEQSLLSFGSCVVIDASLEVAEGVPDDTLTAAVVRSLTTSLAGQSYEIGPDEPDPTFPSSLASLTALVAADDIRPDWHGSPVTLGNTFAANPLEQDCLWFFDAENTEVLVKVLDACDTGSTDHFWVFYGATTNVEFALSGADTLIGTSGAFANPGGVSAPVGEDWQAFDTTAFYFDNSIYRCGWGHVAYTACAADPVPMEAGALVTVTAATLEPIPIEGDGTERIHEIDFGPAGGPAYRVEQSAEGWTISSSVGATRARALFRDNALMLVAPEDELPEGPLGYVWRTTVDGRTHEQPVVPVASLITTPAFPVADAPPTTDPIATDPPAGTEPPPVTEPLDEATESLAEFYDQLSASLAAGDQGFALDRLHPTVLEAYPTECPAALERFADPDLNIEFVSEGETGPWTWEIPDGPSFDIPDATTVTIVLTGRGQAGTESEAHVALVDGQYRWFTFCA